MFKFLAKLVKRDSRKSPRSVAVGQRVKARIAVEELMPRVLLSASPVGVVHGHLMIHGTHGNDVVSVSVDTHNHAKLDVVDNQHMYVVSAKGVSNIELETGGGHDKLINHTALKALVESQDQSGGSETESGDDSTDGGGTGSGSTEVQLTASLSNGNGGTGQAEFNSSNGQLEVQIQGAAASSAIDVVIDGNTVGTINTDSSGNGQLEITGVTAQSASTIAVGDLQGTFSTAQDS